LADDALTDVELKVGACVQPDPDWSPWQAAESAEWAAEVGVQHRSPLQPVLALRKLVLPFRGFVSMP